MTFRASCKKEAEMLGLDHYFTGKPCKYGHVSERYTQSCNCIECRIGPAGAAGYNKKYYDEHIEECREVSRRWQAEHPEKKRESIKRFHTKHPEKRREYARVRRAKDPEKMREYNRRWYAEHPEKAREYNRRNYLRRRAKGAKSENAPDDRL